MMKALSHVHNQMKTLSLSPRLDNSMKMCTSVANNNAYLFTKDSRSNIHLDVPWGYHLFYLNWILRNKDLQDLQDLFHIPMQ